MRTENQRFVNEDDRPARLRRRKRVLTFVASGSRPTKRVTTTTRAYDVGNGESHREARQGDSPSATGCALKRLGCPCGVPF